VVVVAGLTSIDPPAELTLPTPWSIEAEVALVMVQLRVELCPELTAPGLAVKLVIVGGGVERIILPVTPRIRVPSGIVRDPVIIVLDEHDVKLVSHPPSRVMIWFTSRTTSSSYVS